jgi:hypothetical protein
MKYNNLSTKQTAVIACSLSLVIANWFYLIHGIKYETNDDMIIAISGLEYWIYNAIAQGRLGHFFNVPLGMLPYLFDNNLYLTLCRIFSLLFLVTSLSLLSSFIWKNIFAFPLTVILCSLLWSFSSDGHNVLTSYPVYIPINWGLFFILIILSLELYRDNRTSLFILTSLFGFFIFIKGEFFAQLLPVYFLILLFFIIRKKKKEYTWRAIITYAFSLFGLLFFLVFRYYSPSIYAGNSDLKLDLEYILPTWYVYTTGLFPLFEAFRNYDNLFNSKYEVFCSVMVGILATGILVYVRQFLSHTFLPKMGKIEMGLLFLIFLSALVLPNALISTTTKYQTWALVRDVHDYVYSSFSYLILAFLLSLFIVICARNRVIYLVFVFLIGGGIFLTSLNNAFISSIQKNKALRWELFSIALPHLQSHPVLSAREAISLSDALFMGIPQEYYWSIYASKKLGFNKLLNQGSPSPLNLDFSWADSKMRLQVNDQTLIEFSKTSVSGETVFLIRELNPITTELVSTSFSFDKNFYSKESDSLGNFWRWANGPAQIKFYNTTNKPVTVNFQFEVCGAANDSRRLSINFNQAEVKSLDVKYPSFTKESLTLLLKPGENTLDFAPQYPSQTIGNDPRQFSFQLKNYTF